MGIIVKGLTCPQCNSADVKMTSETNGVCNVCGAQFVVKPDIQTQNVINEVHIHSDKETKTEPAIIEPTINMAEILPEFSKEDFIRQCWIHVCNFNPPLDIFNEDFGEVKETDHEIVEDHIVANLEYRASIGYKLGSIIDWRPTTGTFVSDTVAYSENLPGLWYNDGIISSYFYLVNKQLIKPLPDTIVKTIKINDSTKKELIKKQDTEMRWKLKESLQGNEQKDVNFTVVNEIKHEDTIYRIKEYAADFTYRNKTYTSHSYSSISCGQQQIPTDLEDLDFDVEAINNEENGSEKAEEKRKSVPDLVWNKTKNLSFLTIGMLALSIFISAFIHFTGLVLLAFAASLALFIAHIKITKKEEIKIAEQIEKEINDYSTNYEKQKKELLNKKLLSLGLKPVEEQNEKN